MSQSGVSLSGDCVSKFNELKLNKKIKYIIYKLTDDYKEIVIEEASEDGDWEAFREKLVSATQKNKAGKVGKGPRYAVYDFSYELASGEGTRSKITFIAWSPDDAGIQPKMIYASSKDALKRALNGLAAEFQANDEDDIEYQSVLAKVSKGLA
ncbi:cofilin [Calycina marina]|uniref:Cofilin n=1 Tax=Calycina marina TaxID=1763456 RepID=A0A9P7YY80_9HELO|nr:cofilin [Calycina marina]